MSTDPRPSPTSPTRSLLARSELLLSFSLLGLPAITIPAGLSAEGLPLGLQLVGPAFGEAQVLAAG